MTSGYDFMKPYGGFFASAQDDDGETPIIRACSYGTFHDLKNLLEMGEDINSTDLYGHSALHICMMKSKHDCLKLLLEAGANPMIKDHLRGQTPLHIVYEFAENSDEMMFDLLCKFGADINAQDNKGNTPLHLMVKGCRVELISKFIEIGADVTIKNNENFTPMQLMFQTRSIYFTSPYFHDMKLLTKRFLEAGDDINGLDSVGNGLLHNAVIDYDLDRVEVLLDLGANPNLINTVGATPIFGVAAAVIEGIFDKKALVAIIRKLVNAGADVNFQNKKGRTILHFLAALDNSIPEIWNELFNVGADLSIKDKRGMNAMEFGWTTKNKMRKQIAHRDKPDGLVIGTWTE